jgi:hypothetical protein
MSRTERTRPVTGRIIAVGLAAATVLVVVGGLLLREHAPGNMGNGFLISGLASVVVFGVVGWRAVARPGEATTFERAWTQTGDERDDAVLTWALSLLGFCAVPLTGIAGVTMALGVDEAMVMALLLLAQIGVGVVGFAVATRRQ